jgi:methylenetetrahydrofolate dehydrogenase (NADP+) / methenyltetrahydrofolate cyclohydrolase
MAARILDGAAIAGKIISELKQEVTYLRSRGVVPGLAAVQVGENPASRIYLRNKAKACADAGVHSEIHQLSADSSEADVLALIAKLNCAPEVHGIIVQLPLPKHLDAGNILQSIAVEKDVDGFNWRNLGALVDKQPELVPCTPLGVMALIDHIGVPVEGRDAVIVGRSGIVGMPAALLLIARGATVTVCNSKTVNLARFTTQADILVAAAGKPGIITAPMVKPGAVVIDVGITRLPNGKITGDVDFESVKAVAAWITPVPGGVGPMTVAMLIANTIKAAGRNAGSGS